MKKEFFPGVLLLMLLLTSLVACNSAEGANWQEVAGLKGIAKTFIDRDSIRKSQGNIAGAWAKISFSEPVQIEDQQLVEEINYYEFKCGTSQYRVLESTYSYKSGKTERIASGGMKSWKNINKESTRAIYEHLCKGRR